MRNFAGPESIAYGDLIAGIEASIPAPKGAVWRKKSWRFHAIRKNGLTRTELEAIQPKMSPSQEDKQQMNADTTQEKPADSSSGLQADQDSQQTQEG